MEKKYEIIKNGLDDYTLKYKDQEINFKSNVEIVTKLQDTIKTARLKMIVDLTKAGISLSELTKETKKDGKTYYDNTNKEELENTYIQQEQVEILQNSVKELLHKDMEELVNEIGLDTIDEIKEFTESVGKAITGRFQ